MSSGCGFPGQRISKKLMARVRAGVELVRASLAPTRELITLDLPTLDRPRKAISGSVGAGKCERSVAEARKRERTLMVKFATKGVEMASLRTESCTRRIRDERTYSRRNCLLRVRA